MYILSPIFTIWSEVLSVFWIPLNMYNKMQNVWSWVLFSFYFLDSQGFDLFLKGQLLSNAGEWFVFFVCFSFHFLGFRVVIFLCFSLTAIKGKLPYQLWYMYIGINNVRMCVMYRLGSLCICTCIYIYIYTDVRMYMYTYTQHILYCLYIRVELFSSINRIQRETELS